MREIKFRAWEKHSQTMTRPWELSEIIDRAAMWCNNPYWEDPVMQFTGLHDKNGVEIYEGDIVKHYHGGIGEVVYLLPACRFDIRLRQKDPDEPDDRDTHINEPFWDMERNGEVIGNIYENPELLENSDDS